MVNIVLVRVCLRNVCDHTNAVVRLRRDPHKRS